MTGNSRLTSAKTQVGAGAGGLTSVLSSSSGKDSITAGNQQTNIKKFYDPCYKRCRCLKHGESNKVSSANRKPLFKTFLFTVVFKLLFVRLAFVFIKSHTKFNINFFLLKKTKKSSKKSFLNWPVITNKVFFSCIQIFFFHQ